jgi:hypothetical protein
MTRDSASFSALSAAFSVTPSLLPRLVFLSPWPRWAQVSVGSRRPVQESRVRQDKRGLGPRLSLCLHIFFSEALDAAEIFLGKFLIFHCDFGGCYERGRF